jgi:hypothetical protein
LEPTNTDAAMQPIGGGLASPQLPDGGFPAIHEEPGAYMVLHCSLMQRL